MYSSIIDLRLLPLLFGLPVLFQDNKELVNFKIYKEIEPILTTLFCLESPFSLKIR